MAEQILAEEETGQKEDRINFDIKTWRRFFKLAMLMKKELLILVIAMISLAGMETLTPLMTRYAIDHFVADKTLAGLPWFGLAFLVIVVLTAVAIRFFLLYAGRVEIGLSFEIRRIGFDKLQELSFTYYDRTPVGWILSRMISDISRLSEVIAWGITDIAWGFTTIFAILITMFIINWQLALIVVIVLPPLVAVSFYFQKHILKAQRQVRQENSRLTGAFNEGIMGAKTSKTLLREAENLREFSTITDKLYGASVHAQLLGAFYLPIVSFLGAMGAALVLWQGGDRVVEGVIMVGTLYVFVSYVTRIFDPIRQIARVMSDFQSAQAAAERVLNLLAEKPDLADDPAVLEKYKDHTNWPPIKGDIEYRHVSFSYVEGETVLEDFNLSVQAGQMIALVGETGSGKSTLVNLVCRFYEPTSGQILIDGIDYRERPMGWLYSNLGYVLQSPYLFNSSVRENIRFGNLAATDEAIREACRKVHADEFIEQLEDGYETVVGEGGNRLSTGQKQLISFARAIVGNPRMIILDEATSSIDTETEQLIQKTIATVLEGRTSFVVAHRLSTIRKADRILLIEDGRIAESGTHHDLMRTRGKYYDLFMNQFIEEKVLQD